MKTNSPELIDVAEEAFGSFQSVGEPQGGPLVIMLVVKEGDVRSEPAELTEPRYHTKSHHLFIALNEENMAVADVIDGYASGYLTPELVENRAYVRYYFLEALCQSMLAPGRNFLWIHAACIRKNGVSVILQGKSGSGKSTLAYACLRSGYQLLAEDVVHVKFDEQEANLRGAPWKFHLLPDAVEFFPEIEKVQPKLQLNGEWKLEIDIESYYPGSAITSAKPGPILLVTRNPHIPASIEMLPPEAAVREFEVLWPFEVGWSAKHEKAAMNLLQNGVYRLYTGKNIFDSISLIDELVEKESNSDHVDSQYASQSHPEEPGTSSYTA